MKVKELSVGPIVGWTQFNATRIWGRGKALKKKDPPYCIGVAKISKAGQEDGDTTVTFKMLPHFDFTGVYDFTSLEEGQQYDVKMGCIHHKEVFLTDQEVKDLNWKNASEARVTTPLKDPKPDDPEPILSFVFGSCRYILRFLGIQFDKRGDKTFRSILQQIDDAGIKTDLLLMVGDQIYADDLNFLAPDKKLQEYLKRYRIVFRQPYLRKLMSKVPTYMILDDHEIRNDWTQDKFFTEKGQEFFPFAKHAYMSYQWVHGPGYWPSNNATREDATSRLWYYFDVPGATFFAVDTRTERFKKTEPPVMVSPEQLQALKDWMTKPEHKEKVKFIATSVPFFPDQSSPSMDKWEGFREQRNEILEHIRKNKISKVVFLAGDVHASLACQLVCSTDPDFRVSAIISSSFFYPYSHSEASNFKLKGTLEKIGTAKYSIENPSKVVSANNFTRVTLNPAGLDIEVFGRKGAELLKHKLPL